MATAQTLETVRPSSAMMQPLNKILAALPREEYERVLASLEPVRVTAKQVLQRQGEPVTRVFFPNRGVCSITAVMQDGLAIEVGMVGAEGMTGVAVTSLTPIAASETRVQIGEDPMLSMSIQAFRAELERHGKFAELVNRYTQAFLRLVMQSCACNGLHSVDERCCRWLLMVQDRIARDELPLTQDSVASALGVRRPTITLTINALRRAGLLNHGHRKITILNRKALEAAACECYQTVRTQVDQLVAASLAITA